MRSLQHLNSLNLCARIGVGFSDIAKKGKTVKRNDQTPPTHQSLRLTLSPHDPFPLVRIWIYYSQNRALGFQRK
ncbi:unnamed protein product [Mycena citricolor]|uniref:Uncharacterized protein n=1 Tax=Mycena citricolor TaxID=2018698 RepID=A0AAD2Q7I4_9AGAR|nr:unnamed protein product [Mycena citricolor]CAK5285003.1 unnamed protein product [Mycena citricolor]